DRRRRARTFDTVAVGDVARSDDEHITAPDLVQSCEVRDRCRGRPRLVNARREKEERDGGNEVTTRGANEHEEVLGHHSGTLFLFTALRVASTYRTFRGRRRSSRVERNHVPPLSKILSPLAGKGAALAADEG